MAAADQIQLYKLLTRQIANNMGYTACYLPKPVVGVNGSGMHTNVSVSKGKTNLFWDEKGEEQLSTFGWNFLDRILTHALDLCLIFNSSVNAYRRLDPHFEAPNQIRASAVDRGAMVRVPIGNHRSMRTEVRAVAPDANPYLSLYGIFKTGLDGEISKRRESARRRTLSARQHPEGHRRLQGLGLDRQDSRRRRAGPLCRAEAGRRQPLPARAGHHRQRLRGAVPPRGLQPVALEFVLENCAPVCLNRRSQQWLRRFCLFHPPARIRQGSCDKARLEQASEDTGRDPDSSHPHAQKKTGSLRQPPFSLPFLIVP